MGLCRTSKSSIFTWEILRMFLQQQVLNNDHYWFDWRKKSPLTSTFCQVRIFGHVISCCKSLFDSSSGPGPQGASGQSSAHGVCDGSEWSWSRPQQAAGASSHSRPHAVCVWTGTEKRVSTTQGSLHGQHRNSPHISCYTSCCLHWRN